MSRRFAAILAALTVCGLSASAVTACPFCSTVSRTFSEEIASMDVVVTARLVEAPEADQTDASDPDAEITKSKFEIVKVIKGQQLLGESRTIELLYLGSPQMGETYLIMGVDPPDTMWSTPLLVSDRAQQYIFSLLNLPEGPERLGFFLEYLEDEDEMLTRDAYDEFARAPYADVCALKDQMDHDQLVAWINDRDVPVSRRRLYLTLLGVCGTPEDIPQLEDMLRSDDDKVKEGLDALIACYLILKGPDGMPLVEELYLKNEKAEYRDTYAAIMALRFHGTESDVIPRDRLLAAMRHILDRPELADLVIPDFARWEDWSVMPRLVQMFKEEDDQTSWVREPVIRFLRACPLAEAKEHVEALKQIDPEAVKRADLFFPFAAQSTSTGAEQTDDASADTNGAGTATASQVESATEDTVSADLSGQPPTADESESADTVEQPAAEISPDSVASNADEGSEAEGGIEEPGEGQTAPVSDRPDASPRGQRTITTSPLAQGTNLEINVLLLLAVAFLLGLVLFAVMWLILGGATGRSK